MKLYQIYTKGHSSLSKNNNYQFRLYETLNWEKFDTRIIDEEIDL